MPDYNFDIKNPNNQIHARKVDPASNVRELAKGDPILDAIEMGLQVGEKYVKDKVNNESKVDVLRYQAKSKSILSEADELASQTSNPEKIKEIYENAHMQVSEYANGETNGQKNIRHEHQLQQVLQDIELRKIDLDSNVQKRITAIQFNNDKLYADDLIKDAMQTKDRSLFDHAIQARIEIGDMSQAQADIFRKDQNKAYEIYGYNDAVTKATSMSFDNGSTVIDTTLEQVNAEIEKSENGHETTLGSKTLYEIKTKLKRTKKIMVANHEAEIKKHNFETNVEFLSGIERRLMEPEYLTANEYDQRSAEIDSMDTFTPSQKENLKNKLYYKQLSDTKSEKANKYALEQKRISALVKTNNNNLDRIKYLYQSGKISKTDAQKHLMQIESIYGNSFEVSHAKLSSVYNYLNDNDEDDNTVLAPFKNSLKRFDKSIYGGTDTPITDKVISGKVHIEDIDKSAWWGKSDAEKYAIEQAYITRASKYVYGVREDLKAKLKVNPNYDVDAYIETKLSDFAKAENVNKFLQAKIIKQTPRNKALDKYKNKKSEDLLSELESK